MHTLIGHLGHFSVIASFVASVFAAFSFFKASTNQSPDTSGGWLRNGISFFVGHAIAVLSICVCLFVIIANHYFEYHYAYSYSDTKLPKHYLISTFWNGQEGSFLLWIFWQALLGLIIIFTNKYWTAPVMTVFSLVQAFLGSMILGVVLPGLEIKLGSSPFILLRDAMDHPAFKANPEFIPADGTGLNPLLQNYWMVIHPPTLFLGFACVLVPFAYCIAGLWKKKYHEWIRPALPWTLFGSAILGLGILMGGYWAYETLNFGGYWNWDPVENAVYIPWLVLIGGLHTMISYKHSGAALKASIILIIFAFILILYSTFLTRSGILGDTSVHSFTDLGLSGQLLVYLLFFLFTACLLLVLRWREIPSTEKEASAYSKEFWIFIGVTVLCLMGFQVLIPTSYPVWNALLRSIGVTSNLAPPSDQVAFYSNAQIWFAIALGLVSGTAQFFWWKRIDKKLLWQEMYLPVVISVLLALVLVNVYQVYTLSYILLLFAGVYTITSNGKILLRLLRKNPSLSAGSIAHIGVGLMLIGILFSAGYSKIVSLNNTGMLISRQLSNEYNREHLLLFVNEPRSMAGYGIEYKGVRLEPRNGNGYLDPHDLIFTEDPYKVVTKRDVVFRGAKRFHAGDTVEIFPENTYYEIQLTDDKGRTHHLFPRIQDNPRMGLAASPDIKRDLTKDLYAHVDRRSERESIEWSKTEELRVQLGQQFFANDFISLMEKVEPVRRVMGVGLDSSDIAVKATIRIKGEHKDYIAEPYFIIKNRQVGRIPDEIADLGILVTLLNIHPETGEFSIGINTRQKDWIVIRAMEKPFINVLWIGTLVVMAGFAVATYRRAVEFKKMKAKDQE